MKRILLICTFFTFTGTAAIAQTDAPQPKSDAAQQNTGYTRMHLSSAMAELDAGISRDNEAVANSSMTKLMEIMVFFIGKNSQMLETGAAGDKKEAIAQNMEKQNALYSEIKMMSQDKKGNKDALQEKLNEFLQTL